MLYFEGSATLYLLLSQRPIFHLANISTNDNQIVGLVSNKMQYPTKSNQIIFVIWENQHGAHEFTGSCPESGIDTTTATEIANKEQLRTLSWNVDCDVQHEVEHRYHYESNEIPKEEKDLIGHLGVLTQRTSVGRKMVVLLKEVKMHTEMKINPS